MGAAPLSRLREVSAQIAAAVAEVAHERGLATRPRPRPENLLAAVRSMMYEPDYPSYV